MSDYINQFNIVKKIGSALKVSTVVSCIFQVLTDLPDANIDEYHRLGKTEISISQPSLLRLLGKLTPNDILIIEDKLIEYGETFGFEIKFVVNDLGFSLKIKNPIPEDDPTPDDGDGPYVSDEEYYEYDIVAAPLVMGAAAGRR